MMVGFVQSAAACGRVKHTVGSDLTWLKEKKGRRQAACAQCVLMCQHVLHAQ